MANQYRTWTRDSILGAMQGWYGKYGERPTSETWKFASYENPCVNTVARMFGSWTAAMRIAGFPPYRGKFWTEERVVDAFLNWVVVHGRWPTVGDWEKASPEYPASSTAVELFGGWNNAKKAAGWDGKCRACRRQLGRSRRLWCNDQCRHRGPVKRVIETCPGCGREGLDDYTLGCDVCNNRESKRRLRAAA